MTEPKPVQVESQSIRIFHQGLLKTLIYFFILILIAWGIYSALPLVMDALFLIIVASILTAILNPLVDRLESEGVKRSVGALIVFGGIFAILGTAIVKGIPTMLGEAARIKELVQAPSTTDSLNAILANLNAKISQFVPNFNLDTSKLSNLTAQFFGQLGSILAGALNTLTTIVFVLIITMFFLIDGARMQKRLIGMVPNRYFEMSLNISYKTKKQLTNFLRGQLLAALGVGIQSIIGLSLLNWIFDANISGVFLIGSIAGMANMIPFVGPFMGMAPAIVVSLFNNLGDPVAASHFYFIIHIIVMFFIVQMIDNNVISPIVVSGSMEMHPLTVILLILVGSQIGVLGMFLAVPAWGIFKVVVQEVYKGLKGHHLI